jgi:hypothetical protein
VARAFVTEAAPALRRRAHRQPRFGHRRARDRAALPDEPRARHDAGAGAPTTPSSPSAATGACTSPPARSRMKTKAHHRGHREAQGSTERVSPLRISRALCPSQPRTRCHCSSL